jgi:ubiquinone/menaquinone biosynthesis C-methylase UbiE
MPVAAKEENMKDRGEGSFARLPRFAASLYDFLASSRTLRTHYDRIAEDLAQRIERGRLLDVGTGPGRLLIAFHGLRPNVELSGLDVSAAMIQRAKKNLSGIPADLRQGSIRKTAYAAEFFDAVTCTGSFYLWNEPAESLDEVHRILRAGGAAYVFDTRRDYDPGAVWPAVKANLREEGWIRRLVMPRLLARQFRMTYSTAEYAAIVGRTRFANDYDIEDLSPAGLPALLRITLNKRV